MPTTIVSGPTIDERKEQPYMGIRVQTPMSGMSKHVTKLFKEINTWAKANDLKPAGVPFLRFHVIDMEGEMDIEVGVPVAKAMPGDDRVKAGIIPAGRYASLIYIGNGYTGNKTLVEWAKANHVAWDRWDDPKGDGFRCRYESYLTDPKIQPLKTKWEVEVAIKLADQQPKGSIAG
jgi:effector-binding domain-containing protein